MAAWVYVVIIGVPLVLGFLVRRWWLFSVLLAVAVLWAIGYHMWGHEADDLSVDGVIFWTLVPLSIYVVPSLLVGLVVGRRLRRPPARSDRSPSPT